MAYALTQELEEGSSCYTTNKKQAILLLLMPERQHRQQQPNACLLTTRNYLSQVIFKNDYDARIVNLSDSIALQFTQVNLVTFYYLEPRSN